MVQIRNIGNLKELTEAVKENTKIGDAIRLKCLDCSAYQWNEVLDCKLTTCPLWNFRKGKNPFNKRTLTDEQKKEFAERMKKSRE